MYEWMGLKKYRVRFASGKRYTVYDFNMNYAKVRARRIHRLKYPDSVAFEPIVEIYRC